MSDAKFNLERGNARPFDAPDAWWSGDETEAPPPADDWAHEAARGILYDLRDRRGIKHGFSGIDEDVRAEIAQSMAAIIRAASPQRRGEGMKASEIHCDECGDGEFYPMYGMAPHQHDISKTGSFIGSTTLLPKEEWPAHFKEDSEAPGCGVWSCPNCGGDWQKLASKE